MTSRLALIGFVLAAMSAAFAPRAVRAMQQPAASQQKAAPPQQKAVPPQQKAAPVTKQGPDTKAPATKSANTRAPARPGLTVAPPAPERVRVPPILREVYTYDAEGRRDPFVTLLTSDELRPTVADLRLVGVLLDPVRPIAVMREVGTNTQYRVTTGMKIGRMTVAMIKRRSVIFSIEEFGLNRMDSVVLGDTTKVRAK